MSPYTICQCSDDPGAPHRRNRTGRHQRSRHRTRHASKSSTPLRRLGASRYRAPLPDGLPLEALLVNKDSDILVVSLHGATDREKYSIPRFEWLKSMLEDGYSALYLSDPTLAASATIWSWPGTPDPLDSTCTRCWRIGRARPQTLSGRRGSSSSGRPAAASQPSRSRPTSLAAWRCPSVARRASRTTSSGHTMGAQRSYVEIVMPHLAPAGGVVAEAGRGLVCAAGRTIICTGPLQPAAAELRPLRAKHARLPAHGTALPAVPGRDRVRRRTRTGSGSTCTRARKRTTRHGRTSSAPASMTLPPG